MNKPSDTRFTPAELRQRAERLLAAKQDATAVKRVDQLRLLHELQVHQIELEMQNEALHEAHITAETALERYSELFDFAPVAYFILTGGGIIQQTNFRGETLLDSVRSTISGQPFAKHVCAESQSVFQQFVDRVFASEDPQYCEMILQIGGKPLWVSIQASGNPSRNACLATVLDINQRKQSEEALRLSATVYLAIEEAIMVADISNRIVAVNPAFTRLTGYTAEEAIGQPTSLLKSGRHDEAFYQELWDRINLTGRWQGEIWNRRKNGDEYLERLCINTVYGSNGEAVQRVALSSDLTEKKRAEDIIQQQVNIDPLTGLPNRRMFLDRLQQAIQKTHRAGQKLALLFLDLDHFKDINDTLGHDIGDCLLKETVQRLQGCLREADTLARPGGDEFTLILSELSNLRSIDRVAQAILRSMAAPFELGSEHCHVTFSIGITLYPDDALDIDGLLKKADQAMYAAKRQGGNRACYFLPTMQILADRRLRLINDLHCALAKHQLWVAYQPIVELASGAIHKAEALLRWQHPELGLISPFEFIPIAESTGIIIDIGDWVFQQAANQVKRWRADYYEHFQISVNKSPVQFHNKRINHGSWFEYLTCLNLPGYCIAVEITEGLLLDASPMVAEKLYAFRDSGMQVSLDDFGTGYSSLSYLRKFDIDYLKIDESFVRNLGTNATDLALCEAMILMAHKLGMKVIAEGIETQAQRDLLELAGCDYGQGYLFSEALPAGELEKLFPALG